MTMHRYWLAVAATAQLFALTATADETRPRTVSVSGMAEVNAEPDFARVTLGIEARRPALQDARAAVAAAVDRVLTLTRDLKIDPKSVNATRIQIQPDYRWDEKTNTQVLQGYFVRRQVEVELRDLDQLGTLLERAVDAGVNQVGDPVLDSSRRKELEREAMGKAVEDAKLNAETLARAAGVRLGAVRTLSGSGSAPPMPMHRAAMAVSDARGSPEATYQTGEMKFSASVNAEYDLSATP